MFGTVAVLGSCLTEMKASGVLLNTEVSNRFSKQGKIPLDNTEWVKDQVPEAMKLMKAVILR